VRDIPTVAGGLAQTPGSVIAGPRPRFDEERDRRLGGTFAELDVFGKLGEVPTRVVGHPEVDWGALFVSGDTTAKDAYRRTITEVPRSGLDDTGHVLPER
jgi:arabinosyltransferase B